MPGTLRYTGNSHSTEEGLRFADQLTQRYSEADITEEKIAEIDVAIMFDDFSEQRHRKKTTNFCRVFTDKTLGLSRIKTQPHHARNQAR